MTTLALKNRLALYRHRHGVHPCPSVSIRGKEASPHEFAASGGDIDLGYALQLPPEKAIEYFKSKGFAFSWDWQDVWQEAHSRAFTVAKSLRLDVLQTIRAELQTALDEGMLLRDFQKNLEPKLKALGWWGKQTIGDETGAMQVQLGSPWRLKQIYGTNLQTSYMAGTYRDQMENVDNRPYWQYQTKRDNQVRPAHRALDGLVFRYDDPFWQTHYPPNDWGCRCTVRALSEREVQQRKLAIASGEGNLVDRKILDTTTGELMTVTEYRDPKTGARMAPGVGWNYNVGRTDFKPDLNKYDPDIRRLA